MAHDDEVIEVPVKSSSNVNITDVQSDDKYYNDSIGHSGSCHFEFEEMIDSVGNGNEINMQDEEEERVKNDIEEETDNSNGKKKLRESNRKYKEPILRQAERSLKMEKRA